MYRICTTILVLGGLFTSVTLPARSWGACSEQQITCADGTGFTRLPVGDKCPSLAETRDNPHTQERCRDHGGISSVELSENMNMSTQRQEGKPVPGSPGMCMYPDGVHPCGGASKAAADHSPLPQEGKPIPGSPGMCSYSDGIRECGSTAPTVSRTTETQEEAAPAPFPDGKCPYVEATCGDGYTHRFSIQANFSHPGCMSSQETLSSFPMQQTCKGHGGAGKVRYVIPYQDHP